MIERLRGSVDFSSRLRVARQAVYEGRFLLVHMCVLMGIAIFLFSARLLRRGANYTGKNLRGYCT